MKILILFNTNNAVTSSYGLQQLISQPKHLLANSSSCTEPIFTDQLSLIVDSGTHLHLFIQTVIITLFIAS